MTIEIAPVVFLVGAVAIALVGTRMMKVADRLADRTGWGEAIVGATLLGAATSLPGITASVTAAIDGKAQLALSNALGGIAAQTAFLAVADLCYRKANLEHAAASVPNMLQATLLIFLLASLTLAMAGPAWTFFSVHPITPMLVVFYFLGMKLIQNAKADPMWKPLETDQTETDEPDEEQTDASEDWSLWIRFGGLASIVISAGYFITKAVQVVVDQYAWLDESAAGAFLTAVATSLPELVTSIAAVRRGALTLAVGGIIGGNCFDTLFAAVADVAYRDGSIYHAAAASVDGIPKEIMLIAASMAMTAVVLSGLLYRQKQGFVGIGYESITTLVIYALVVYLITVN